MPGVLYIVPTPVGNLEDMTLRAIRVLREADLILAEDTRTSSVLLRHYDIHGTLQSHHKYNEHRTVELLKDKILGGLNVALVSDAGTPGISDPGFLLARACAEEGIEVQTLPGATACIPAIVSSGLPCDRFCFEGFLPQKKGRQSILAALSAEERTMIFYESPHRLVKTLEQMADAFGPDRKCSVAREISKLHEQHHRGTLSELSDWFRVNEPKGEIVITVAGVSGSAPKPQETVQKEMKPERVSKYRLKHQMEEEEIGDGEENFRNQKFGNQNFRGENFREEKFGDQGKE